MSGEDFGYLKDEEQGKFSSVVKKALVFGTILFSISCFFYITINAYYFVYNDRRSDIPVVKSPDFAIKVYEENQEKRNQAAKDTDKSVYENIVGNKKEKLENNNIKTVKGPNKTDIGNISKNNKPAPLIEKQNPQSAPKTSKANINKNDGAIVVYNNSKQNSQTSTNQVNQKNQQLTDKAILNKTSKGSEKSATKAGQARVQLAALKNQDTIEDYWNKLNIRHKKLLSGLSHFVEEADLGGKGKFYRLQVGNFRSQNEAENFCIKFIAESNKNKSDCIVVE